MNAIRFSLKFRPMRRLVQIAGPGILLVGFHLSCTPVSTEANSKQEFPIIFNNPDTPDTIYMENEKYNTVSLNCGNFVQYVGSRGDESDAINNTFDQILRDAGQSTEDYLELHTNIHQLEKSEQTTIIQKMMKYYGKSKNFQEIYEKWTKQYRGSFYEEQVPFLKQTVLRGILNSSPIGNVFLDIWEPEFAPYGNPKNMGMLYVVPPNIGEEELELVSKMDFLQMVSEVSKNIMICINEYNKKNPQKEIEMARIRLVPTDKYHHPEVSKQEVADYFFKGLIHEVNSNSCRLNFEYNEGVFRTAYDNWIAMYTHKTS